MSVCKIKRVNWNRGHGIIEVGKGFNMFCNINGIDINYEIIGEGHPIIMLNGDGVDLNSSKCCMEPLYKNTNGWKRIYMDQPGVGLTETSDKINSGEDILDLILLFIERLLPGQKFSVGGRSLGAYLAMGVFMKKKEFVEGMLLICPPIDIENRDLDENLECIENLDIAAEQRIKDRWVNEMEGSNKRTDRKFIERVNKHLPFSFDIDSPELYCDKPTLIITGRQDTAVGFRDQFKILKWLPRATYITLDKAGHIPQIEQEDIFNLLVDEWLYRITEERRRVNMEELI